ncbi:MAG TPA: secretin and TonB N-terminal domain-containing protein [Sedimentisphaerales bacterium]|nr:secretin and TonB N-terminal domain-containing protein [Sedimentisphaerales bacterium]
MPVVWLLGSFLAAATARGDESHDVTAQASLRQRLEKRISAEFHKTPIEDVVRMIAEQADVDVVTSPSVTGEATVRLTDVPLQEALRSILEVHGFDYVIGDNIVRILAQAEMPKVPERQVTRIFEITYAEVGEVVKSIEKFKSDVGSVTHIDGTSHILVTDTEAKIRDMGLYIDEVDRITPQILVEARIYDVTSKDRFDLGVQWAAGTRTVFDAQTGVPDVDTETNPFTRSVFNGTAGKSENTTGSVRLGWLTSDVDIDVMLRAQQENINAKLLANPRILVLNDKTASIKIVSEIPYQQLQESSLGGNIGTTAFREAGVELEVTAHLAVRDQMIRLHMRPSFSVVTGEVMVSGTNISYAQPVVDRREADTTLIVKNGQTVVLGGLKKKEVNQQVNKVPLLGDLPLVGGLFRFKGEETINSELLVFITPWIVEQPTMTENETRAFGETEFTAPQPSYTAAEEAEQN